MELGIEECLVVLVPAFVTKGQMRPVRSFGAPIDEAFDRFAQIKIEGMYKISVVTHAHLLLVMSLVSETI